ncbi:MAG: SMP-30/gluconolactonase/LRE family protein [Pseudomonadota bacterium]
MRETLKSNIKTTDSIVRLDPGLDALVPADAAIEKLAGDLQFIEGPVWVPGTEDRLFFSDIPGNTLYSWSEANGVQVVLRPIKPDDADTGAVGGSNGLTLDLDGQLILCEHGNRRVARLQDDGSRTTLADRYDGKRLNSPNDIVVHSSGAMFFTDPPYGLEGQDDDPAKELTFSGIYRLDADGELTLLSSAMKRPNGLAFSPDERTLYVSNSGWPKDALLMRFPVHDDLTLGEPSLFFDTAHLIGDKYTGTPDGFKVDEAGNVYTTGPDGVLVISPAGKHLGTIKTPEVAANVGWGDDGSTLYITATTGLYRIKLTTQGLNYRSK